MMKYTQITFQLIGKLFLFIVLAGCQQNDKYTALLLQADSIMNVRPDSALALLNLIQFPQEMKTADRALYSLLFTQAEQKNRISHTNDSLIRIAVDYYKDKDDKEQETKAYYYLGCVYQDIGDIVGATDAFLKALNINPQVINDTERLTMIYENLAECYQSQGFYDKAMEMYRISYKTNINHNEEKNILFSLQGIGEVFMYQHQWDSAAYYYNEIIEKSRAIGDSSWISIGISNLAHVYYNQKKYPEAYHTALKSIHNNNEDKENEITSKYILLGDILIQLGQYDSARYYLSLNSIKEDPFLRASRHFSLYELEKKCGKYKEATQYIDTYTTLYDSLREEKNKEEIAKLINSYTIERYKREISEKQKHQTRISISFFILIIISILFIFLMIDRHRKQEYIGLHKSLMKKRGEIMKMQEELNSMDMNHSPNSIQEKENKQNILKQLQKEKFYYSIQLFQKTSYYKTIQELKQKRRIEEKVFTSGERGLLWDCIYQIFSDTMSYLKAQCPELTREDLLYCIFYLLGYSNSIIIICTGSNANALKSRKNRLKNKMTKELYSFIFSTYK
jgi:tetratricopeptide (TPR) repeat protein